MVDSSTGQDQLARQARDVSRVVGPFHNIIYYAPEMKAFADHGLSGYWRAYMAYRAAPMGPVPASVVTATFYNFAPQSVAAAIPEAWDVLAPADILALRNDCIDQALRRALVGLVSSAEVAEAAQLTRQAMSGLSGVGRPLYAAHAELEWPDSQHMALWHGATLWREYRGDGHNIALAAEGLDGIECHVLVAARNPESGVGDTIQRIRGWTADEWDAATQRLVDRGLVAPDGSFTQDGRDLRRAIEIRTDQLATAPCAALGSDGSTRLCALMGPLVGHLVATGSVAGSWPPDSSQSPPAA